MWADFPKNRHCKHAIYRGDGGSVEGITEADILLIAISQGGTGASTAAGARTSLGLGTAATTASSDYATAAQGTLADSAVQPTDIGTVATSNSYDDLDDLPTLGTASAEDVGYFATAAQGALADSAIQSGDLATVATTGSYNDLTDKPSAGSGTVTSVAMSVPTGLAISGSPVTTTGTLAVTYDTGYAIPTTAKQTEWDTAYTDRLKWDGGSTGLTASTARTSLGLGTAATTAATDYATAAQGAKADTALQSETYTGTVTSVAMSVPTGLSVSGSPVTTTGTLAVSLAAGYSIPTTTNQTNWSTAYSWGNHASAGYLTSETYTGTVTSVGGTGTVNGLTLTGTVTSSGSLTLGGTLDLSSPPAIGGTTPAAGTFSTLKVGSSSILGNANADITLGLAVRNSGASMGYIQTYNSNAGADLKTWRMGGNGSGEFVVETVNDAYSSSTQRFKIDSSGNLTASSFNGTIDGGTY